MEVNRCCQTRHEPPRLLENRLWHRGGVRGDEPGLHYVNSLAGSERVLTHGLLRPNLGKPELEEMERQVKELKISVWKMYTGAEMGEDAWWMDDEKVNPASERHRSRAERQTAFPGGRAASLLVSDVSKERTRNKFPVSCSMIP